MPGKILVVDDEPVVTEIIRQILSADGHAISIAHSGKEALGILRRHEPELMLTDLMMPEMDGAELFRKVKQQYPRVGVVIVTAISDVDRAVSLMTEGAYDYVTKPFDARALRIRTQRALERHRMALELEEYRRELELKVARQTAQIRAGLKAVNRAYRATLVALSVVLEARDRQTGAHADRVVYHVLLLARKMGLKQDQLISLEQGAILHDIGKVGIPDSILLKPGPLTPEEMEVIKSHPIIGCKIIENIPYLHPAMKVVRHHHEWYNGEGYPDGLKGKEIPIVARIFSVADAYDAMTSDRPYRKAFSEEHALEELRRCAGTQFDPDVVDLFTSLSSEELALPKTAGSFIDSELLDEMVGRTIGMYGVDIEA